MIFFRKALCYVKRTLKEFRNLFGLMRSHFLPGDFLISLTEVLEGFLKISNGIFLSRIYSKKNILLLVIIGNLCLACKSNEEDNSELLAGTVTPERVYVLPLTTVHPCSNSTTYLSPNVVQFKKMNLSWSSTTSSLDVIGLFLQLKSPYIQGGSYSCPIIGDELSAFLTATTISSASSLETPNVVTSRETCSFRCGDLLMVPGAPQTSLPGTIKVLGVEVNNSDDSQVPLTQEISVTVEYKKF